MGGEKSMKIWRLKIQLSKDAACLLCGEKVENYMEHLIYKHSQQQLAEYIAINTVRESD